MRPGPREALLSLTVYCRTVRVSETVITPRLVDVGRRFDAELDHARGRCTFEAVVTSCECALGAEDFGMLDLRAVMAAAEAARVVVGARLALLRARCLVGHCQVIRIA